MQLASIDPPIDEGLLVTMFVESFGDMSNSPLGTALSLSLCAADERQSHMAAGHFAVASRV